MPQLSEAEKRHLRTVFANKRAFLKIEDYTDEELDATILVIGERHSFAFALLNFIDCYFERRRRKQAKENPK